MARLDRNSKKQIQPKLHLASLMWLNTALLIGLYVLSYLGK